MIEELMRQGRVLGTNDIAGLVLMFTVLGAAVVGVILLALVRRGALPSMRDTFAALTAPR
jgi:hypothetical protein